MGYRAELAAARKELAAKWDEKTLAYMAGYMDGEGCFQANSQDRYIYLSLSNTHKPTLEWIRDTFGGNLSKQKPRKELHYRPIYQWRIWALGAYPLCKALLPYLKEKKEQAEVLIQIQETLFKGGGLRDPLDRRKPHPSVLEEREILVKRLKELKHVSW